MLGFLFGFNARLGRLHFFLGGIVLAVIMTAICFAIAAYVFGQTPRGATPSPNTLLVPALCVTPFFLWATFTLQAMRIRDIGWDPVIVIALWFAAVVIDAAIAAKFPQWAAGKEHHQTVVGLLVNFIMSVILLFWPSGRETGSMPDFGSPLRGLPPEKPRSPSGPSAIPAARMGAALRTDFGRRGV